MTLIEWMLTTGTSQKALAERLQITEGAISHWVTGRKTMAAERVLDVAAITDFRVTPHELRPDLYPNVTDGLPVERQAA